MTEAAAVLSVARLGWPLIAKVPWLTRGLLRRTFPASECKTRFSLEVRGDRAMFELLATRPMHALAHLELSASNTLPCDVQFDAVRLTAHVDSTQLFDAVLNCSQVVPAARRADMPLHEITLTAQQVNWLRDLSRDYARVQFTLYYKCKSVIHDWEMQGNFEFPVYVRIDSNKSAIGDQQ